MDTLTFISSLVRDLSTPISAIIILCIIVRKAPALTRYIKSIKYKDVTLDLKEYLELASNDANVIKINSNKNIISESIDDKQYHNKIVELAKIDPNIAIYQLWKEVEISVIRLIQYNGLVRFTRPEIFVNWLCNEGKITKADQDLFFRLKSIRDRIDNTYADDVEKMTTSQVLLYNDLATLLIRRLEMLRDGEDFLDYPLPPPTESDIVE